MTLGKKIKVERKSKAISLRKFAKSLEISAAYLVDIEKDRREPPKDLLQKIADLLDIPNSTFDEYSPDVPKVVKEWFETTPHAKQAIKTFLGASPQNKELLILFEGSVTREKPKFPIAIYESELQAIGLESTSWETETGGDLFGIWADIPIVFFASKAGPNAKRSNAHFQLDVDYLIRLSAFLEKDWGLRYFGDWHSHHRLGLQSPSTGDRKRIVGVAAKNGFKEMAEFIITFSSNYDVERKIVVNPYAYLDILGNDLTNVTLIVLQGISPIRSALIEASSLREQQLEACSSFSIEKISIPEEPLGRLHGAGGRSLLQISECLLLKASSELSALSTGGVEIYREPFGLIIVVPTLGGENVAFAFDKNWPHILLQVYWMDRKSRRTEEINTALKGVSLLKMEQLKEIYSDITRSRKVAVK